MEEKVKLREMMLNQRFGMDANTKLAYDNEINQKLIEHVLNYNSNHVHVYLPMKNEINIFPFIHWLLENDKVVIAPKVLPERQLQNLILHSLRETETGSFGTYHPAGDEQFNGEFDLIVTPGLAFDLQNNRLGYGGGYYDRFLASIPEITKIGIHYPFQLFDSIPTKPHDIKLNNLLTAS